MPQFFITKRNNLPDFFKTISADNIQGCCESKVYHRGLEYFKYGYVADASNNIDKTRLKTLVKGNSEYTVIIGLQNGNPENCHLSSYAAYTDKGHKNRLAYIHFCYSFPNVQRKHHPCL